MLKILSVNVGKAEPFEHTAPKFTGIFKKPQTGPVHIGAYGLAGDAICDLKHHGGLDQAVYLYGQPDYDFWSRELGRKLKPGTFGENLTIANLESASVNLGDRFTLGPLVLEVNSPRIPCRTFAARMDDKFFAKKFLAANRPGIYCRVLAEGPVQAGDALTLVPFGGEQVSMIEMNENWNRKDLEPEEVRRFLATPVHWKFRQEWEGRLGKDF
jgi:MOSC domain-containing protein YiiM